MNEPASGAYANGDTIFIDADISDEDALYEAFVCIRDSAGNKITTKIITKKT